MDDIDFYHMGHYIKQSRINAKMTQEQLAERIGKSTRYIQGIENEGRSVGLSTLYSIITTLNVSFDPAFYKDCFPNYSEAEQLSRIINQLDEKSRNVLLATAKELLKNQE